MFCRHFLSLGAWYSQRRLEHRIAEAIEGRRTLLTDVTHHLRSEMGLMPISMLRDRRNSFVEVNASHCGMGLNAEVYRAVARSLGGFSEDEESWAQAA